LTGLLALTWHIARRRRAFLLIVTLAPVLALAAILEVTIAIVTLNPDTLETRARYALTPIGGAFLGPGYGTQSYGVPQLVTNEFTIPFTVVLALALITLTVRHTRANEDSGRLELLHASPVGILAPGGAPILMAGIVTAATIVGSTTIATVRHFAFTDAFVACVAIGTNALLWGAFGVFAAQVCHSARSARLLSIGALMIAYTMRALGDMWRPHGSLLSWLSPLSWAHQTRAFVDLRLWPIALNIPAFLLVAAASIFVTVRRDFGLRPPRKERARPQRP